MTIEHGKLIPEPVPANVILVSPDKASDKIITERSPATNVMTDLNIVKPFSISPDASIRETNDKMIACGVRLLFVLDSHGKLLGLITSNDIIGEKPMRYIAVHGGSHGELSASQLMTPLGKLEAVPLEQIKKITVGQLLKAVQDSKRHHMLVVETAGNQALVRGIISVTQIGRQLGIEVSPTLRATSFAQLNKELA